MRVSSWIQARSVRLLSGAISRLPVASEFGDKAVMASTSECTQQLGELKVSDPGCGMGESSMVSEYVTAHAMESEHGLQPCELFLSAQCESIDGDLEKSLGECGESKIKVDIERSKQHWSLLADPFDDEVGEGVVAEVDNVEVFKALQMHPTWGRFFDTFGHDVGGRYGSQGKLVVGKKFAEGGQGELYHAQVMWKDAKRTERDLEKGREWVVKVFKEGTFLRQVYKQLPHGYLQYKVECWKNWRLITRTRGPRYRCDVVRLILLKNGRFAFLMRKEHFDLRSLIEGNLKLRSSEDCGPFSQDDAEWLMYNVAEGVKWLHEHDIVHRDLKASNVLVKELNSGRPRWHCVIADYECSVGVVGTGFFRAPEILQACKDGQVNQRPELFSRAVDVYSYGMTCYEILTGKLPYGPEVVVPEYVDDWTHLLLSRCWQLNPLLRPSMEEILASFLEHSSKIRGIVQRREYQMQRNQQS